MIPIHLLARKAVQSELAAGKAIHNYAGKRLSAIGLGVKAGCDPTAARLVLAVGFSLGLAGAVIALQWGGVGLFYEPPEMSVRPGINAKWMSPNIAPLIARLESEGREIYRERSRIAALLNLKEGDDIAEVGAGSGFLAEEFARRVGPGGRVYAIEINPAFVSYIEMRARRAGLENLRAHLGAEDRLNLSRREGGNFDYIVLASTYHYLEYPKSMLRSMHRLLRGRGELIVVDFRQIPDQSPAEGLEPIRLSKDEVIREITEAGFDLAAEPAAPFLAENYVLRFRKR